MEGDKRNFLFRYYARFLVRYKPKYFVFENVLGLLTAGNKKYLHEMILLFESIGYSVAEPTVLNAEEYGVLQRRRRVIIVGHRGEEKFDFSKLQKVTNNWQEKKEAIKWLRKLVDDGSLDRGNLLTDFRLSSLRKEPEFIKITDEMAKKFASIRLELSAQQSNQKQ